MSTKYQELYLTVSELVVNKNNYRHEPLSSEQEAINRFCTKSESKLLKLADSIAQHGIFPTTTFIVYKTGKNKYTALDGNRRLTALKIINDPTLVPITSKVVRAWATSHKNDFSKEKIRCIEYFNEEMAGPEIYDIHSGQSQTNERWTKTAQIRYDKKYLGIDEPLWFQVVEKNAPDYLESLEETDSLSTIERIINKTNLDKYMPIHDNYSFKDISEESINAFRQILIDAIADKINTRTLNSKMEQSTYLDSIFVLSKVVPTTSVNINEGTSSQAETISETPTASETSETVIVIPPKPTKVIPLKPIKIDPYQIRKIKCINPKTSASEYSGIIRTIQEINRLYSKNKGSYLYEQLPLSTMFLVRTLFEQALKLFLKEYHNSIYLRVINNGSKDANLSDMIVKINNLIKTKQNGTNIFDSNIDRSFITHFDRVKSSHHENLNIIIHHPHTYTGNIQLIHDYTQGVTYDVIEHILMKLN